MYLSFNLWLDSPFAVHLCALSHIALMSCKEAVKHIVQYLHGTKNRELFFTPSGTFQVDCYGDEDFDGLWYYEDVQDQYLLSYRLDVFSFLEMSFDVGK